MFISSFIGLLVLGLSWWTIKTASAIAFESCAESPFTGNCTTITRDGAIGSESANTVLIQNGSLNYGILGGCPYQNNTCTNGFAYYGWIKFWAFPTQCNQYHVAVSTPVFNIHLLGNGHLAAYAWLPNGTEYYAESISPMLLNVWYPIIVEFKYFSENSTWRLILIANDQLVGGCALPRSRTYSPPIPNLVFGGNGISNNCSGKMQFDRNTLDGTVKDIPTYYAFLFNIPQRQSYCNSVGGVLVRPMTCYYVVKSALNWTQAYQKCKSDAYTYGYPNGKLASFPNDNATEVFNAIMPKIASYGNGSITGYTAWMSAGRQFRYLIGDMSASGGSVVVPTGVVKNTTGSNSSTCLYINTKPNPWQWAEMPCSTSQPYICEMTFDCVLNNPCKNQGSCLPVNDGQNICKCYGETSGKYCEKGIVQPTCINSCSCPLPDCLSRPASAANCSICIETGMQLRLLIHKFIYKLKLVLLDVGADGDLMDNWQCYVFSTYYSLVKKIFDKTPQAVSNVIDDILISFECSNILEIYAKILLYGKVIRKFIKYYLNKNGAGLPNDLMSMWASVNETITAFTNLPCFVDFVVPKLPTIQKVIDWCDHDDDDDDNCHFDGDDSDSNGDDRNHDDKSNSGENANGPEKNC